MLGAGGTLGLTQVWLRSPFSTLRSGHIWALRVPDLGDGWAQSPQVQPSLKPNAPKETLALNPNTRFHPNHFCPQTLVLGLYWRSRLTYPKVGFYILWVISSISQETLSFLSEIPMASSSYIKAAR